MKAWQRWLGLFFVLMFLLIACDLFSPCGSVYFEGENVMVPECIGTRDVTNIKYDSHGFIISYDFRVVCEDGSDYSGSATFTRDSSGYLISKKLVVNGTTCEG